MPTVNKTKTPGTGGMYAKEAVTGYAEMLRGLQGIEISDNIGDATNPEYKIFFDGIKDLGFKLKVNSNSVECQMINENDETISRSSFSYSSGKSIWLREYTAIDDPKCRLISLGMGGIGENLIQATPICIITANDVNEQTVYGISASNGSISMLRCLETGLSVNLTTIDNPSGYKLPSHLADGAQISKAVNLCDPNLPEMKSVYTALFRPFSETYSGLASPRYYISGAMWGCVGSPIGEAKCNVFDPMIKI